MGEDIKRIRVVQFIFDNKMVEFNVDWSQEDLANLVTEVMKDDGFLWVPYDEERGTGAFVNIRNCTNIKLLEYVEQFGEPLDNEITS